MSIQRALPCAEDVVPFAPNDPTHEPALLILAGLTRARNLLGPAGRCSGWWRRRHFVLADCWSWILGRRWSSGDPVMTTSASMVAAPIERRQVRGHRQRSENLQHRQRGPRVPYLSPTRAREALMMAGAGGAMRATGWRATAIRFQQFGEGGPRVPYLSPTRAREALMMAGAGGAMRATGWRATAIRFQQFGEGARVPSAPRADDAITVRAIGTIR